VTAPENIHESANTEPKKFSRRFLTLLLISFLLIGAVLGIFIYYYANDVGSTTNQNICNVINSNAIAPGIANATSDTPGSTATFTIIESDPGNNYEGMNGSAFHVSTPWPVIQVYQGQKVVIQIFNCASSESHGFAISTYLNSGVTVRPGQSYTLTFVANQQGTFRVYCSIFCAIHPYMQNGELLVSP
jgi:FtsP/CotA-like multicopper oxidase with cupredoxin domain